ncbi:alpha/beta fold hydrolase [Actibacterium lipolyticum]|uniref:Alpha/beta hydrolase family protein n=1 Tax=Actibacterium lipolyticum TaxID=1524263 RepID=A0A238JK60_9RHOB|nr:alpha/beta fold hydrolase [Actibacterium lipolyticum]SMX31041.1 Alpha/beta hydrolase family protein [Actibacterium lipolyticum]
MSYRLKDFGSYTAGGRIHAVTKGTPQTVQFTRTASYEVDPRGHFAVEHAYVQYFIPESRNTKPPVVLVHGGGMSGACWETTPDGRPGWLHLLLARGYEVHVIDNVERGRAGFAPGLWGGDPILRSMEEAWVLFRFGPKDGFASRTPFAGQKFPVAHFDAFVRSFTPRWLNTTSLHTAALLAVLRKTGPATVICHSQGGEVTFDAQAQMPELFASIIALEPSGVPQNITLLGGMNVTLVAGDFLDTARHWKQRSEGWASLAAQAANITLVDKAVLPAGHSHMMMMDQNNHTILEMLIGD